jgi:GNAT superfamily N-acetyltransferase
MKSLIDFLKLSDNQTFKKFEEQLLEINKTKEFELQILSLKEIKNLLKSNSKNFPLISTENDNSKSIDDSKFLNDELYSKIDWFVIKSGNNIICIFNFRQDKKSLYIPILEVNKSCRGLGWSKTVFNYIEKTAKEFFKEIKLMAFDEEAISFWTHMGFEKYKNYYIKSLK